MIYGSREHKLHRVKLALAIISGRTTNESLENSDLNDLGYDSYKFGYYGRPSEAEIKANAEDIIVDMLVPIIDREET